MTMPVSGISPYVEPRLGLVQWLRSCLIGPGPQSDVESEDDLLTTQQPTRLYPTGILFPITMDREGIDQAAEPEEDGEEVVWPGREAGAGEDHRARPLVPHRRYVAPSAVGFSFYTSRDMAFHASGWGVRYESRSDTKHQWQRIPLSLYRERTSVSFQSPREPIRMEKRHSIWADETGLPRAEIFTLWRPHDSGWLISVSLCNRQQVCQDHEVLERAEERRRFEEMALFEVELECEIFRGEVYPYPRKDPSLLDEEEREHELQYRHKRIFAIGHGAAVDWHLEGDRVKRLTTSFLPTVEVPLVTPENENIDSNTLSLEFLGRADKDNGVFQALDTFVLAYGEWLQARMHTVNRLKGPEKQAGQRIVDRIQRARDRMAQGVDLLRRNPQMAQAFALTHQAMLMQWTQYDRRFRHSPRQVYRWRPFQLGFLLLTLESLVNPDSPDRDVVDLIWFPTGGGKTEAYLALIAFQIIWRRMRFIASGGGTTVIMRYTLRLLTRQQFERAARLICALELLRRNRPKLLGEAPITAGMWVGNATTPNTFKEALTELRNATAARGPRRFVFTRCPWCGEPLWHFEGKLARHGYHATENRFQIRCLNRSSCEFGSRQPSCLPVNVVDEALYADPPTLLLATVDKLARLAWDHRSVAFFGGGSCRPPELIVQDELHLIAGALGSIVGIYEAALDSVLIQRGVYPKYVASTATIRNAQSQIQRLYGRPHAVFPPPGISADDSFFTRSLPLEQRPGRLYLGYMASILNKEDAFAALAAALRCAPEALGMDTDELRDAWRTLVVYHGSLRGVGQSHNALIYRTKTYLQLQLSRHSTKHPREDSPGVRSPRSNGLRIAQLTSHYSPEENARTFGRLELPAEDQRGLDAVLATNMISVGLDVDRLALMIINGQPLTTAEYIQASSRVGRSDVPGLVVANYYRWQARSLSHYENFRPYHESFYRFVEPTSVTPFTQQVRERALHAALVIVMRLSVDYLRENSGADAFNPSQAVVQKAIDLLKRRCTQADPDQSTRTEAHIDALADAWRTFVDDCRAEERKPVYQRNHNDRACEALLCRHQDPHSGKWETLSSMRNVEETGLLSVTRPFAPPRTQDHD